MVCRGFILSQITNFKTKSQHINYLTTRRNTFVPRKYRMKDTRKTFIIVKWPIVTFILSINFTAWISPFTAKSPQTDSYEQKESTYKNNCKISFTHIHIISNQHVVCHTTNQKWWRKSYSNNIRIQFILFGKYFITWYIKSQSAPHLLTYTNYLWSSNIS